MLWLNKPTNSFTFHLGYRSVSFMSMSSKAAHGSSSKSSSGSVVSFRRAFNIGSLGPRCGASIAPQRQQGWQLHPVITDLYSEESAGNQHHYTEKKRNRVITKIGDSIMTEAPIRTFDQAMLSA